MLHNDKKHFDRKAVSEGLRRTTAGALALILSAQLLFGNGSASAIAEELANVADGINAAQTVEGQGDDTQAVDEQPDGSGEFQTDDGSVSDSVDTSGAEEASGEDADSGAVPSSGEQDADGSQGGAAESGESSGSGSNANTDASDAKKDDSTGQAEEAAPAVARSWDDATGNLVLTTDGLSLDGDAVSELAEQISAYIDAVLAGERDVDADTYGEPDSDAADVVLPSKLPVSLSIKATLDPAAANGRDGNADHNKLLAGDTFTVSLPDGVEADLDSAALREVDGAKVLDVYQADASGNPTSLKVAEAVVERDALIFKLVGDELPSALSVSIDLACKLDSSKVGESASSIEWVLQESAGRKAELLVPAKSELAERLGLVRSVAEQKNEAAVVSEMDNEKKSDSQATDTPGDFTGSASFTTVFADNAAGDRPSAEDVKDGYKLYFKVTNGDEEIVGETEFSSTDASVYSKLGLTAEQAAVIGVGIDSTSFSGQYTASASKLPKKLTRTYVPEGQSEAVSETYEVTWSIKHEDAEIEGYRKLEKGAYNGAYDDTYYGSNAAIDCYQKLTDVTFKVVVLDGTGALDGIDGVDAWLVGIGKTGAVTIEKNGASIGETAGVLAGSEVTVADGKVVTISSSQPAYYPDNSQLDYKMTFNTDDLKVENASDGTFDGYQVIYTNASVANHVSDVTAAYNGGTASLTRYGTTSFYASKYWYDEDSNDRPATTYALYRYSVNGGSPATAAQVSDASGKYISFTVSAEENNKATGEDPVDLSVHISGNGSLAKYDPDGCPYVYFLREDAVSGYRRVAGVITEGASGDHEVSVSYNRAEYDSGVLEDGDWGKVSLDSNPASATDALIYNRGTISNVRVGTVDAELTKTWVAGAYQDQLKDVTVVMQLKRHGVGSDGKVDGQLPDETTGLYAVGDDWESVGDPVELTGWATGNMSQTVSATGDKYDDLGHEYVYQWCEVDVRQNGQSKFTSYDEGVLAGVTGTAVLDLHDEQGIEESVHFAGDYSAVVAGGTVSDKTITNSYDGETYARVTKYWSVDGKPVSGVSQPYGVAGGEEFTVTDASGNKVVKTFPSSLTFDLYQDEVKFATGLTMDGTADDGWREAHALDGTTFRYRESSPWTLDFDGLPKYDAAGSKYLYQSVEKTPEGFSSSSSFSPSTDEWTFTREDGTAAQRVINYTEVVNTPYPGEGTLVRLAKDWEDGGNNTGRNPVTVEVYAATDVVKRDGTKLYSAGETIGSVTLNDENGWYKELWIAAGSGRYLADGTSVPSGFEAGAGKGFYYGVREVSNDSYDVIDKAGATGAYADVALSPWKDGVSRLVTKATDESDGGYAYDISYEVRCDLQGAKIVTVNRRVGLVNITLSKTWKDEGAEVESRPNAYYEVTPEDEGTETVFVAVDGNVCVRVPGSTVSYPLYIDAEHTRSLAVSDLANSGDFSRKLSIRITGDNAGGLTLYGFPKYDDKGVFFGFTAAERVDESTDESPHDYTQTDATSSASFDSYLQHSDQKTYSFANTRTGTKDVTFFTRWYDHYVKDTLNQRPDVYLTLYTLDDDGNPHVVSGYEAYKWSERQEWNGNEGLDQKYNQSAVIRGLQKYDANGKEIVYYATITPSVSDGTYKGLDYTDVSFGTDSGNNGNNRWDDHEKEDPYLDGVADSIEAGGKTALREDGTFIFKLDNNITVNGTKIWENLPADYTGDLPTISIFLQRRLAQSDRAHDEGWDGLNVTIASGDGITGAGYDVAHYTVGDLVGSDDTSVVAWTTLSGQTSSKTTQRFEMSVYGDNSDGAAEGATRLPLYDEDGNRYEFYAREIMDGLIQNEDGDPKGGFTLQELVNIKDGENNCYTGPIIETSGIGSSFRMKNTFKDVEQHGRLSVTKTFSGRADGDKFPTVTFTLYRAVDDGSDDPDWTKVGEKSLDTSKLDTNGTGTVDFDDLDIYAPDGSFYQYKVAEKSINGYETYAAKGSSVADDAANKTTVAGLHAEKDGSRTDASRASFLNKYVPESDQATLSGTKTWYDQSNISGIRPDSITLKVVRSYDGKGKDTDASLTGGVVVLQSDDPNGANYISWTKDASTNVWSYKISNLEKWAPNGQPWYYTATEESVDGYEQSSGSGGTVQANNASKMSKVNFGNYLDASVGFTKTWADDGGDSNYQRPRVYLRLQARVKNSGGSVVKAWADAGETFNDVFGAGLASQAYSDGNYLSKDAGLTCYSLPGANGTNQAKSTIVPFNPNTSNKQSFSSIWKNLPTTGIKDGVEYEIEYRVVEVGYLFGQDGSSKRFVSVEAPSSDTGSYGDASPYSVEQTGSCAVKNTLTSTSATVTKTWDDNNDSWGVRPSSVTYRLRRKAGDGSWAWVTKYGADATTSSAALAYTVDASMGWKRTVSDLPSVDANGNPYTYQFVEELPAGYSVEGASYVAASGADSDEATNLVVVCAAEGDQTFKNELDKVSLTGTKTWETYGCDKPSAVNLTVTQIKGSKSTDITKKVTINWSKTDSDAWAYEIEGLPKTASDGTAYSYKVTEKAGSSAGFWPSNPSANATASETDPTVLINGEIKNTATKFTFDKVDAASGKGGTGAEGAQLNGVEFSVKKADGSVVATWYRDEQGVVSASVTDGYGYATSDGYIVGLAAGTYTVSETEVPANHLKVANFSLTISATGEVSVAAKSGAAVSYAGQTKTATVTVTDEVTRGQVTLQKVFVHGGKDLAVAGMTFDLYKMVGSEIDATADVKLASGITTSNDGSWTSKGSAVAFTDAGRAALGAYYQTLSDGLPAGTYYFKETGEVDLTAKSEATYSFTISAGTTVSQQVRVRAENDEFNASATLTKVDASDSAEVKGAVFQLKRGDAVIASDLVSGTSYQLDVTGTKIESSEASASDGVLAISGFKKGAYTLSEVSNVGYEVDSSKTYTLNVQDSDNGQTLEWVTGGKVANTRLTGTVSLAKTSSANGSALAGCEFKLQKKGADGQWFDVSGKSGLITDGEGKLSVSGLDWGTYRFVETTPAAGYLAKDADGNAVTSGEVTIDRQNVAASVSAQALAVTDDSTELKLQKLASDGATPLEGAEFTVTPATGSTFADGTTDALTLTSGTDGTASASGKLVVGSRYVIEETKAPTGYALPSVTKVEVKVEDNGAISAVTSSDKLGTWSFSGKRGGIVSVRDNQIGLAIRKTDNTSAAAGLAGAEFTVTPAEGSAFADGTTAAKTLVSNAAGQAQPKTEADTLTGQLVAGNCYVVAETAAPAGYAVSGSVTLVAQADGSFKFDGDTNGFWSVSGADGAAVLTARDTPVELNFQKLGEAGDALSGAVFFVSKLTDAGEEAVATVTTGADGTAQVIGSQNSSLTNGSTYVIRETTSPAGYVLVSQALYVDIDERGNVSASSKNTEDALKVWSVDGSTLTASLTDTKTTFFVQKLDASKGDADEALDLSGAEFSVTPVDGFTFADGTTTARTLSTDKDGKTEVLSGVLVVGNSYTVQEAKAPAGFAMNSGSVTVKVEDNGALSVSGDASDGFAVLPSADGVGVSVKDARTSFTIKKLGAPAGEGGESEPLSDVELSVVPAAGSAFADGSAEAKSYTTGQDGSCSLIADLVAGNIYKLTEVRAHDDYSMFTGAFVFTVSADGATLVADESASNVANGTVDIASDGTSIEVVDNQLRLGLAKVSASGDGSRIADAVFELSEVGEDGSAKVIGTLTTGGTNNTVIFGTQLKVGGTYTLKETTAPNGYSLAADSLTFTVNADGTIEASGPELSPSFTVENDDDLGCLVVIASDAPTELAVYKRDASGLVALGGAEFELTGVFADSAGAEKTETLACDQTAGTVSLASAKLIADGKTVYTLRETKAPRGYELNDAELSFTVGTDGAVAAVDAADGYSIDASGIAVVATDEAIRLGIAKYDAADKGADDKPALDGARFRVRGSFADSDGETEVTVDVDGFSRLAFAQGETYTVEETLAPAGYELAAGVLVFSVDEHGRATVDADKTTVANGAYALVGDSDVFEVYDEALTVTVDKTDLDGAALDGARYTLAGEFPDRSEGELTGLSAENIAQVKLTAGKTYTLTETTAPDGYKLLGGGFTFTVNADGTIAGERVDSDGTAEADGSVIVVRDVAIALELSKEGLAGTGLDAVTSLSGAEYEVSGTFLVDGKLVEKTVSVKTVDDFAALRFVQGNAGEHVYTIRETAAPTGYKLDSEAVRFYVDAQGNVRLVGDAASYAADGARLTQSDAPLQITLSKQDAGGEVLSGAEFTLKGAFVGTDRTELTGLTVDDIAELQLESGVTYELTETRAPAGYEVATGTLRFKLSEDGSLIADDDSTMTAASIKDTQVTVVDEPILIEFAKTDEEDLRVLSGAVLVVSGKFADGTTEQRVVSDNRGKASLAGLFIAGERYSVREEEAPYAYELIAGQMTFTVNADGTIAVVSSDFSNGSFEVSGDGTTIIARDLYDYVKDAQNRRHRGNDQDGEGSKNGGNGGDDDADADGANSANGKNGYGKNGLGGTPGTGDVALLGSGIMATAGVALALRSLRRRRDEE